MSNKGFSLKDQLFSAEKVAWLAGRFAPPFDAPAFESDVMARLDALELKARIDWIADCLLRHLPEDFTKAVQAIRAALPPPLDPTLSDDDFGDFIFAPLGEYAVKTGLEDHPDLALDLLEEVTQRFSMEWAIRPFLNRWPDLTWARLEGWAAHDSYHVRRLVSEGTRPKLPWGIGVALAPGAALPLLDRLHADRTRFVTRSVANHLNDISKTDPDLVVQQVLDWQRAGQQSGKELDWITRHALRGLVKAGHPGALRLLGFDPDAALDVTLNLANDRLRIGETLEITVGISGPAGLPVLVDYALDLHRPKGAAGRKVFKLKQGRLGPDGRLILSKTQRLQTGLSTYRLHPGQQAVVLLVNGVKRARRLFDLQA